MTEYRLSEQPKEIARIKKRGRSAKRYERRAGMLVLHCCRCKREVLRLRVPTRGKPKCEDCKYEYRHDKLVAQGKVKTKGKTVANREDIKQATLKKPREPMNDRSFERERDEGFSDRVYGWNQLQRLDADKFARVANKIIAAK